ncbi:hypothetical protein T03_17919 [Trichinella britovi]|uniref:Uncharacterized protein n=1 Tax=Trichinella britovi TaxID=45882 RepID=A0A0V1CBR9_TRIBR|nr:hypothetical protein T03_17919 [Trichinella britovi]
MSVFSLVTLRTGRWLRCVAAVVEVDLLCFGDVAHRALSAFGCVVQPMMRLSVDSDLANALQCS